MNQNSTNIKTGGHTCPWWFLFTFDNPIRKLFQNPTKILSPYVKEGDTVLDVGCGMGYFSLALAELVGETGKVIAADVQKQMLSGLRRRAIRVGLADRIVLQQSTPVEIGVEEPVNFALAFWMAHEVRNLKVFFEQIYNLLNPGGKLLIAEPFIHVSSRGFEQTVSTAESLGFQKVHSPKIRFSRAVVLEQ